MNLQKYRYDEDTAWRWRLADHSDLNGIMAIARLNFQREIQDIFTPDEAYYRYQIALAITTQQHHMGLGQILVAKLEDRIIAYTWISLAAPPPYSQDSVAEARMLHIDLSESQRTRLMITVQTLTNWETWALACSIPVIVSASIRRDHHAFMRIHQDMGYDVRGTIAYKRLL